MHSDTLKCRCGQLAGECWSDIPSSHLRWIVTYYQADDPDCIDAHSELRRREQLAQADKPVKPLRKPPAKKPRQRPGKINYMYDVRDRTRTKLYYTPGEPHPIPEGIVIGTPDEPCPFD
ncbi:MAG: hypothetical protein ACK6DA_01290 [Candidatus Kapaibacterium sp.]|jgi:hypothetical protein